MDAVAPSPSFASSTAPHSPARELRIHALNEKVAALWLASMVGLVAGTFAGYVLMRALASFGVAGVAAGFLAGFGGGIGVTVWLVVRHVRTKAQRGDYGTVVMRPGAIVVTSPAGDARFRVDSTLSVETVCSRHLMRGAYFVGPVTTLRQGASVVSVQCSGMRRDHAEILGARIIDDVPERAGIALALHPSDQLQLAMQLLARG